MNVIKVGVQVVTPNAPPDPKYKSMKWGTPCPSLINYVDSKTMKHINYLLAHPDKMPKGTPALAKMLKQIEKDKKKMYTEEQVREIIGNFSNEEDGWDIHFTASGDCCPGDDNADAVNLVKLLQLKRAGLKVNKEEFEEQSGSYLKYSEQHLIKYLKKRGIHQKSS